MTDMSLIEKKRTGQQTISVPKKEEQIVLKSLEPNKEESPQRKQEEHVDDEENEIRSVGDAYDEKMCIECFHS